MQHQNAVAPNYFHTACKSLTGGQLSVQMVREMAYDTAVDRFRFHFRELLHRLDRNQTDVAKRAGLSAGWASGVKHGEGLSLRAVDAIAKELKVDVSVFFEKPDRDVPRHTPHVKTDLPGGPDVATSPVVLALRAIIKEQPESAAEAIAALITRSESATPTPAQSARPRTRDRSRQRDAAKGVK